MCGSVMLAPFAELLEVVVTGDLQEALAHLVVASGIDVDVLGADAHVAEAALQDARVPEAGSCPTSCTPSARRPCRRWSGRSRRSRARPASPWSWGRRHRGARTMLPIVSCTRRRTERSASVFWLKAPLDDLLVAHLRRHRCGRARRSGCPGSRRALDGPPRGPSRRGRSRRSPPRRGGTRRRRSAARRRRARSCGRPPRTAPGCPRPWPSSFRARASRSRATGM